MTGKEGGIIEFGFGEDGIRGKHPFFGYWATKVQASYGQELAPCLTADLQLPLFSTGSSLEACWYWTLARTPSCTWPPTVTPLKPPSFLFSILSFFSYFSSIDLHSLTQLSCSSFHFFSFLFFFSSWFHLPLIVRFVSCNCRWVTACFLG